MKNILLIGLGRFGKHIAIQSSQLGHEIMAVDLDEERVNDALPEKMVAKWATIRYTDDHILDYMEVDASHAIFEVEVPKEWIGKTVGKLDIRRKYDINIMAVKDDGKVSMAISADTCFKEDVTLLVLGEYKAIKKCFCI